MIFNHSFHASWHVFHQSFTSSGTKKYRIFRTTSIKQLLALEQDAARERRIGASYGPVRLIVRKIQLHTLIPYILITLFQSHYSMKKAGAALGFGTENVILVKSNERGKIIPEDLEAKIIESKQKGHVPLYVNATAGTTVYGAFDPIDEIADICEKYNLWLHVDAAWGGGLLMSRKHRHKLNGIERQVNKKLEIYQTCDKESELVPMTLPYLDVSNHDSLEILYSEAIALPGRKGTYIAVGK
ncbi:unnamed protein product [Ranitomeya imitator]|uniref:Glutamate decarboxylase 1 n=1 Tax=Ranitomeya imitator TaxID=111125 RepID=A0ABN9L5Q5_9NEOB|nr:unnamed protein product [Ranitomeya imitator]